MLGLCKSTAAATPLPNTLRTTTTSADGGADFGTKTTVLMPGDTHANDNEKQERGKLDKLRKDTKKTKYVLLFQAQERQRGYVQFVVRSTMYVPWRRTKTRHTRDGV